MTLADQAIDIDVVREPQRAIRVFEDCDAVIPANENYEALLALVKIFEGIEVPLMFDMESYNLSSIEGPLQRDDEGPGHTDASRLARIRVSRWSLNHRARAGAPESPRHSPSNRWRRAWTG